MTFAQDDEPRERPPAGPVGAGDPPPPAAGPGREAEEPAVDGEAVRGPDDDRNLTSSEEGSRPADPSEVEEDIDALLADTQRERDEYLDLAKRTKADFENFRKRMGAEVQAAGARGKGELIGEVVPVLDDLERAIEAAGLDPEGDSDDPLAHGVLLVFRGLRETLARNGVETIRPHGERFDPQLHEALSTRPADGGEPGAVVEVMQVGYRVGEQLIRPARVVVAE